MTDYLVEIAQKDWPSLKKIYFPDDPKKHVAYTTIDNYIRWFEQDPNVKHIKFFCLNGDYSDGTFVVTDRYLAFADTCNPCLDNLSRLLQLLDYSKGYLFTCERPEIHPIILDTLKKKNVDICADDTGLLHYMPKEEALALEVQVPDGIQLRPITELCDLQKVISVYPHRDQNTLEQFKRMAKYNPNIGAFKNDGTLVAWVFCTTNGLLGMLQCDKKYLGQGYAVLVMKYLAKEIAKRGHDVYGSILPTNTPSRGLSGKIGGKVVSTVHWVLTKIAWTPEDDHNVPLAKM